MEVHLVTFMVAALLGYLYGTPGRGAHSEAVGLSAQ
jgi:hypothetical protein